MESHFDLQKEMADAMQRLAKIQGQDPGNLFFIPVRPVIGGNLKINNVHGHSER